MSGENGALGAALRAAIARYLPGLASPPWEELDEAMRRAAEKKRGAEPEALFGVAALFANELSHEAMQAQDGARLERALEAKRILLELVRARAAE